METFFFLFFATMTVLFAALVVIAKNPVHGAISLMASFVQIAALFILLRSPFLAVIQIFVYVGTIMVLFVFVMMMLDIKKAMRNTYLPTKTALLLFPLLLSALVLVGLINHDGFKAIEHPEQIQLLSTTAELGLALFSDYLLPFEVVSVILLVALIGAILMAQKSALVPKKVQNTPEPDSSDQDSPRQESHKAESGEGQSTAAMPSSQSTIQSGEQR